MILLRLLFPLCEWYVDDGCAGVTRRVYLGSWDIWRYCQDYAGCVVERCCCRFWDGLHGSLLRWCCDDVSRGIRSTLFLSTVLIDAKTMPNGRHTWNNSRFRLKKLILHLQYATDACRSGGEGMKPFSASVPWDIVLLQDAIARVQSFIELLQRGNAHDAMGRWITSKSESLVDKMMMNCYKIRPKGWKGMVESDDHE